ncbi:asparaginase domain-containing protein [Actinomadura sp. KC06]|uniref:asparaginase domain-containing protein n=1 Tax=Actinomadura sp. KC06 TaxID=2530369 RepID=UPI001405544E|nr:asparaginase domain-containing protein [Actinomadura sp. KC06]
MTDAARVAVVGARGTIAGVAATRVSFHRYESGLLSAAEMADALRPELDEVAEVTAADFAGDHHTVAGLCALTRTVERTPADAVVVTTGTNELAELAYWLHLTLSRARPVVVTGALRPWTVIGSDGPANLYNAVLLAASGRTRPHGVVVMLNDEILAARDAVKSDTVRTHAFQSPGAGRLGTIDAARIRLQRVPVPDDRWTPFETSPEEIPKVEIVPGYLDAGPETLLAVANTGAAGIVLSGPLSPRQKRAARTLAGNGLTFVAAPHTNTGAAYPQEDAVIGTDLHPPKARLLLMLTLTCAKTPAEAKQIFTRESPLPVPGEDYAPRTSGEGVSLSRPVARNVVR